MDMRRLLPSAVVCFVFLRGIAAAAPFTVINTNDSGPGSLRQAILDANATPGADTIAFNLPGPGVHTISPLSPLPPLTDDAGAAIDGYTQPGSTQNTLPIGDNAILRIELNGASAGEGVTGLLVQSSNNVVRGIVVNRFERGISVVNGSLNSILGCFVGTDPSGMAASPNRLGVVLSSSDPGSLVVAGNSIGGAAPASRNVISGNSSSIPGNYSAGVAVGFGVSNSVIAGNYIGTNAAGTSALPNGGNLVGDGVNLTVAVSTVIGGAGNGAGNVISGNVGTGINTGFSVGTVIQGNFIGTGASGTAAIPNRTGIIIEQTFSTTIGGTGAARNIVSGNTSGILIFFGSNETAVDGNFIGTDITGSLPLGNTGNGISIRLFSTNTTVGAGGPNVIAFNGGAGVAIGSGVTDTSAGARISRNSIHDNGGLGIDLATDGLTANDPGDPDAGPNNLQNYPVLSAASSNGVSTGVRGSLNSSPASSFTIEFFASPACDGSGNGEGQTFLGAAVVTTNGAGDALFDATLPAPAIGQVLTATATDAAGNTSEFSECVAVMALPSPSASVPIGWPSLAALGLLLAGCGAFLSRGR